MGDTAHIPGYHQPLPWTFDGWQISDGDRCPIAYVQSFKDFSQNQKANGALIVNAANSHHSLMTGCASGLNWLIDGDLKKAKSALNGALSCVTEIPETYYHEEKNQLTFSDFLVRQKLEKAA